MTAEERPPTPALLVAPSHANPATASLTVGTGSGQTGLNRAKSRQIGVNRGKKIFMAKRGKIARLPAGPRNDLNPRPGNHQPKIQLRACLKNRSGKGLRARRGRWRGSPRTRAALLCSDSTKAHIREKSVTEEQQLVRRSLGEGGSQRPCPAARLAEIFLRHALKQGKSRLVKIFSIFLWSKFANRCPWRPPSKGVAHRPPTHFNPGPASHFAKRLKVNKGC